MARMRTILETYNSIKELDPGTAITPYYIRQLALSGTIPNVRAGKKILINLDLFLEYLNEPAEKSKKAPDGKIRKVSEKNVRLISEV